MRKLRWMWLTFIYVEVVEVDDEQGESSFLLRPFSVFWQLPRFLPMHRPPPFFFAPKNWNFETS